MAGDEDDTSSTGEQPGDGRDTGVESEGGASDDADGPHGQSQPTGDDEDGLTRRQWLLGGGAVFGFWFLFIRDGSGYDDPEAAVVAFVEHVQAGEDDAASEILYPDAYERPIDLLDNWYDSFSQEDFVNLRTNVRNEGDDRVEIELLYNNTDHFDPRYDFGTLFHLRRTGSGWLIYDFVGSHIGQGFD